MAKLDSVTVADPAAKIASAAVIEMRVFNMTLLLRTSFRNLINARHLRHVPIAAPSKRGVSRRKFQTFREQHLLPHRPWYARLKCGYFLNSE
jgi:hypothetical protein